MDKLKSLLKQLGGSDDLCGAIVEEMEQYTADVKEHYENQFKDRVLKARKICLEEIQKEKAALARKVSIFLESKQETMAKVTEKQRLQEDTEAQSKLKRLKSLLEDVSYEDGGQSRKIQTAEKQIARLTKAYSALKEERDMAVNKANTANDVALKALERNKLLESKVKASSILDEEKKSKSKKPKGKTVKESRTPQKGAKKKRRIGESRKVPSKAKTTRPTLSESQSKTANRGKAADKRINKIAASIDSDD